MEITKRDIYLRIIRTGTLNGRLQAYRGNSNECVFELDHIHNLPDLLINENADKEKYYWQVERPLYQQRADQTFAATFQEIWIELKQLHQSEWSRGEVDITNPVKAVAPKDIVVLPNGTVYDGREWVQEAKRRNLAVNVQVYKP